MLLNNHNFVLPNDNLATTSPQIAQSNTESTITTTARTTKYLSSSGDSTKPATATTVVTKTTTLQRISKLKLSITVFFEIKEADTGIQIIGLGLQSIIGIFFPSIMAANLARFEMD